MSHTIHQEITIRANRQRVFKALTHAPVFAEFSGAPAEIDHRAGGAFSCFGGMITGITLETQAPEFLVQAWRVANWDPGIYSVAKFVLEEISDDETKLIFDHTGFPVDHIDHLEPGWHTKYWEPLKKYLEE